MATYEQMYMIPVAQYEAMRKGGSEGIVGNVSDSNVHNIEVTQGGSIQIDGACASNKPAAAETKSVPQSLAPASSEGGAKKKHVPHAKRQARGKRGKKRGDEKPWDDGGNYPSHYHRGHKTKRGSVFHQVNEGGNDDDDDGGGGGKEKVQLAAMSKNLSAAGKVPNALTAASKETQQFLPPPTPMDIDDDDIEPVQDDVDMHSVASLPQKKRKIPTTPLPHALGWGKTRQRPVKKSSPPQVVPRSPEQEQKKVMDNLIQHRLDQLRGIKSFPPQPKLPPPQPPSAASFPSRWGRRSNAAIQRMQKDRREREAQVHRSIIHELRDLYRQERKESAGKKAAAAAPAVKPALKRSREEEMDIDSVLTKLSKWYEIPPSPLPPTPPPRRDSLKRKRAPAIAVRSKRASYSPPRSLTPRKRPHSSDDDEEEDRMGGKRSRRFGPDAIMGVRRKARSPLRENAAKRRRRGYSPIDHPIAGFKRQRALSDRFSDVEEEKRGRFGPSPVLLGTKRRRGGQLRREDKKKPRVGSAAPMVGVKRKRFFETLSDDADDLIDDALDAKDDLLETAKRSRKQDTSDEELEKQGILEFLD